MDGRLESERPDAYDNYFERIYYLLRLLVEHKKLYTFETYKNKFVASDLSKFPFSTYKSSQYRKLGEALYDKYFA
jgi:hypothetical protein